MQVFLFMDNGILTYYKSNGRFMVSSNTFRSLQIERSIFNITKKYSIAPTPIASPRPTKLWMGNMYMYPIRKTAIPNADTMRFITDRSSISMFNEDLSIKYARTAFIDIVASDAIAAPKMPIEGINTIFNRIFRTAEIAVI